MSLTEIIGYSSAALIAVFGLFFTENIRNLVQRHYSNLNKNQVSNLYYTVLISGVLIFATVGYLGGFQKDAEEKTSEPLKQTTSDEKDLLEVGKEAYDVLNEVYDNKKHKDSVFIANREKVWAYQIGTHKTLDAAWDLYEKIKDIDGVAFLKIKRNEYLVIKYDGYSSEQEINNSLKSLVDDIDSLGEKIQVVDLMSYCSKKEKVVEQKKLKNKKKKFEVRLYECER